MVTTLFAYLEFRNHNRQVVIFLSSNLRIVGALSNGEAVGIWASGGMLIWYACGEASKIVLMDVMLWKLKRKLEK